MMPKLVQVARHTWAGGGVGTYVSGTWTDWGQRPGDGEWNRVALSYLCGLGKSRHCPHAHLRNESLSNNLGGGQGWASTVSSPKGFRNAAKTLELEHLQALILPSQDCS